MALESLINTPITAALNASTYTPITTGTQDCYGFTIMTSDGFASPGFYIATSAAGANETLIPAEVPWLPFTDFAPYNSIIMYAKSVSGTPNLLLFPGKLSQ